MITLHGFDTANTIKVALLLEELGVEYTVEPVNIRTGANRTSAFLAVNPMGKVPVIVDRSNPKAPVTVSESAAILIYLAEKYDAFLASDGPQRAASLQWLMFQAASCGPIFGQNEYWRHLAPEKNDAAVEHYADISLHLLDALNAHLANNGWFAGDDYTIADMAHFGWMVRRHKAGLHIAERRHLRRWFNAVSDRPAAHRALDLLNGLPGAGGTKHPGNSRPIGIGNREAT
ncbi:MAG: glutathione S-transferase N-terminal domain-containing protein [Alphaproteobacteria bacterium]|nr:glutathione S-transferase N-terminal domain-containing protein [Alphaproteobacteria bacterium]